MRHYLMVHDGQDVLGVWEAHNELQVAKLQIQLSLQFPNCQTFKSPAPNYEAFKNSLGDIDLQDLVPEPHP